MGNICCQADIVDDPFAPIMPHFKDYEQAQWLQNDEKMQEWKASITSKSENNEQEGDQKPAPKLMKHKEQDRYFIGSWNTEGFPTGVGQIYEPSRIFFDGNFENGFPEGKGTLQFIARNCQYAGQFKSGKANGSGIFNDFHDKYNINGKWADSRPTEGTITLHNDKNMTNIKFNDYSSQQAIITYRDFRKYEGSIDWKKILPNGHGTVQFPENQSKKLKYTGDWLMGEMHGQGKMFWKDGSIYEGHYVHGKKEGYGKFTFPSNKYYEGYWVDGKQQGAGILFNKDGDQQKKGLFQAGKFIKPLTQQEYSQQKSKNQKEFQQKLQPQQQQQQQQSQQQKIEKSNQQQQHKDQNKIGNFPSIIPEEERQQSYGFSSKRFSNLHQSNQKKEEERGQ